MTNLSGMGPHAFAVYFVVTASGHAPYSECQMWALYQRVDLGIDNISRGTVVPATTQCGWDIKLAHDI